MSKSPFANEPGFLTFEEFYLLPIGAEVETIHTGVGNFASQWKREAITEDIDIPALRSGEKYPGSGWYLADAGLLPDSDGEWNPKNYTRLAVNKVKETEQ